MGCGRRRVGRLVDLLPLSRHPRSHIGLLMGQIRQVPSAVTHPCTTKLERVTVMPMCGADHRRSGRGVRGTSDDGQADLQQRGGLRGGRVGQLRCCRRRTTGGVRCECDRARGRQDRQQVPHQEARHDRPDALGARDQEARRLGLLLGAAEAPARPQDAGPAGQGRRWLVVDQRHGLRPGQPRQLRLLGGRGQRRVGRRQRQRRLQAHGGLRGRRERLPGRRRPDQDHPQQDPAGGVAAVPAGDRRRHRVRRPRRLQR